MSTEDLNSHLAGLNAVDDIRPVGLDTAAPIRSEARQAMLEQLDELCEGVLSVDLDGRIVWINEKYLRKLGQVAGGAVIGRPVDEFIPNSQMREVARTGRAVLLDLMAFGDEHMIASRLPIRDEAGGLIGAVGLVFRQSSDNLKPLNSRISSLQGQIKTLEKELAESRRAKHSLTSYVGTSAPAMEIKRQARRAAQLDATVLLSGETGTGKELLAYAIHNMSARSHRPFVSVNAAAIPEALLEVELFGIASGSYTGMEKYGREGKFKQADGGTLFLDEVGDLPMALQAKLLRVLQEREIEPMGANRLVRVDVRVIAATSQNLQARVAEGRFRSDLYYRLNVLNMHLPPLRDRLKDLPMLTERLLEDVSLRQNQLIEIAPESIAVLARHNWPGNVRELRNVLERTLLLHDTRRLTPEHLRSVLPANVASRQSERSDLQAVPLSVREERRGSGNGGVVVRTLARAVQSAEQQAIAAALAQTRGNKLAAAQALGISRAALYQKLGAAAADKL